MRPWLRVIKWIAGIAAILFVSVVAINLFDEELYPEVAAIVRLDPPAVSEEQNAYFHLIGLAAPESEQAHAAGRKWLAEAMKAQEKALRGEKEEWPRTLALAGKIADLCSRVSDPCIRRVVEHEAAARRTIGAHQLLLRRYRELHHYPRYVEAGDQIHPARPIPSYGAARDAQRIFNIDAALRVLDGEFDAVVQDIVRDIGFSRKALAGSRSIISKMASNALLAHSLLFASELLATYPTKTSAGALKLLNELQPLTEDERRLAVALRAEQRSRWLSYKAISQNSSDQPDTELLTRFDRIWVRLFFLPNATTNWDYRTNGKRGIDLDGAPSTQFDSRPKLKEFTDALSWWDWIYGMRGKVVAAIAPYAPDNEIARMHDLDALVRAVALHAQIVTQGVKDEEIAQFLASSDKRFADPYTGKPMRWDPMERQIFFTPRNNYFIKDRIGGIAGRAGIAIR